MQYASLFLLKIDMSVNNARKVFTYSNEQLQSNSHMNVLKGEVFPGPCSDGNICLIVVNCETHLESNKQVGVR